MIENDRWLGRDGVLSVVMETFTAFSLGRSPTVPATCRHTRTREV